MKANYSGNESEELSSVVSSIDAGKK